MARMRRSERDFREKKSVAVARFQEFAVEASRVAFVFPEAQIKAIVAYQALLDLAKAINAITTAPPTMPSDSAREEDVTEKV